MRKVNLFVAFMQFSFSIIIIISSLNLYSQKDWTIIEAFEIPGKASGLAFDGTYFYFGIYGSGGNEVYQFNPSSGNASLLFTSTELEDTYGMTWDGINLWVTDHANSSNDPAYAMKFDMSGNLITQFDLPDHYMSGIAYDNGDFWVNTYYPEPCNIYKVDATGTILDQITSPGDQPWDICLQDDNLWIVDYNDDMIFKTDMSGNLLESHEANNIKPAGIVFDGTYLWYVDGPLGGNSNLYKVDLGGSGTPEIDIPISEYNYGNITIGEEADWDCYINNNGDGLLTIENLIIPNAAPIFNSDIFPMDIQAGNSGVITLTYIPEEPIELNTVIQVESNDPVTPAVDIILTGYGVMSGPSIEIPNGNHNYGQIRNHATSRWDIQINNIGDETLMLNTFEFTDDHFYLDPTVELPLSISANNNISVGIWFFPDNPGNFSADLTIGSNDPVNPVSSITLNGSAVDEDYPIGDIFWTLNIDNGYDNSIKAISYINDINNDNIEDVIICSENNFVYCINGNAHGSCEILWQQEAGSVYNQNNIDVIGDINNDSFLDIAIGFAWGEKAVKVLSGKNGDVLWAFYTNIYGDGGWVYQVDGQSDFDHDGVKDVLAATGDDSNDTGPKRIFLLNGLDGEMIWDSYTGGPNFGVISTEDFTADGEIDVIAGASNSSETEGKVYGINGVNGNIEWTITCSGSSVWALENLDDINNDGVSEVMAGDFSGNLLLIDPVNGNILQNSSVGSALLLRFERMSDVNNDGKTDIAVASSSTNAVMIDGSSSGNIWLTSLSDKCWNIDQIEDISGDGINDLIAGTLYQNNRYYFLDGSNGDELFSANFSEAIDAIASIPDINGDGSMEMVVGGRDGNIRCISGGLEASNLSANFTADITQGYVPLSVNFTDLSSGEIISWEWDFENDGIVDSEEQNPNYIFEAPGLYSVKLSVYNGENTATLIKEDFIDAVIDNLPVSEPIQAEVFPNPFNDEIRISFSEVIHSDIEASLADMSGKILSTFNQNYLLGDQLIINKAEIDRLNLSNGLYILILKNNRRTSLHKIEFKRN